MCPGALLYIRPGAAGPTAPPHTSDRCPSPGPLSPSVLAPPALLVGGVQSAAYAEARGPPRLRVRKRHGPPRLPPLYPPRGPVLRRTGPPLAPSSPPRGQYAVTRSCRSGASSPARTPPPPPRRSSWTCCARRASSSGTARGRRRGTGNVPRGVGPGGGGRRKASRALARGTVRRAVELKVAGGIMADTADSEGGGAAQLRAGQLYPAPICDWSRRVTPAGKSARRPQRLLTQR